MRIVPSRLRIASLPIVRMPLGVFLAAFLAFATLPAYTDADPTRFNVFNALQGFASVGLLALAVGVTMIARELDLSSVGVFSVAGVIAIKVGEHHPIAGIVFACAVGLAIGALQGLLIASLRIPSLSITVGGLITMIGLTSILTGDETVSFSNIEAGLWLDQPVADVLSPRSMVTFGVFFLAAALLALTRVGRDLRATGDDRRASRAAGVRVDAILVGVFAFSGASSALGGALLSYSTASAAAQTSLSLLVAAITAALLGGVSLAGGRGTALGMACGAISLSLLNEAFGLVAMPEYVSQLVFGALLCVVVAADAPGLRRAASRLNARFGS